MAGTNFVRGVDLWETRRSCGKAPDGGAGKAGKTLPVKRFADRREILQRAYKRGVVVENFNQYEAWFSLISV